MKRPKTTVQKVSYGESQTLDLQCVRYCATTTNVEKSLSLLPMKFCQWTMFEAGRALFMKNY